MISGWGSIAVWGLCNGAEGVAVEGLGGGWAEDAGWVGYHGDLGV